MEIPTVKEFGVQCSPPTPPRQYDPPSPKPPSLEMDLQGMMLNNPSGYIDPNERMTPINYDDPNDHRNYENYLPPLRLQNNNTAGNDLIYHDFDYIGYQRAHMQDQQRSNKKKSFNKSIGVGDSPRQKSMKSVGTIMSPRVNTNAGGVARRDNHGGNPIRHPLMNERLPDIVKRGPINKNKNRTIVGLSLQNQPQYDERSRRSRRAPLRVQKRNSIETTVRSQKPKANARGAILRAQ